MQLHLPVVVAIDYIPLLFLIYVIFAVFSALVKAARQAVKPSVQPVQAPQPAPSPGTPAQQVVTADQLRAALERRLAAAAARAAAAQAPAAPAPIVRSIQAPPPAATISPATAAPPSVGMLGLPADMMTARTADLSSLLASLPPAAQAVVASAIIGPCAAHRGGGHQPEDW